jgi:cytochrome c biogenesis protein CcdA
MTTQAGIDPRAPRFGAGITAVLLLVTIGLYLSGATIGATVLFAAIVALFAVGAFGGVQRHPYGRIYKALVRPRLKPPTELEDPTPPAFAQGVGLVITTAGLVLSLLGVPYALVIAASAAFIAAFLNSVFAYCLGCQIYLLLARTGIVGRTGAASA